MQKLTFLKLILARIKSQSPKFFQDLRLGSGAVVLLAGFIIGVIKTNLFPIPVNLADTLVHVCTYIDTSLGTLWGFTFLPTTDPILSKADTSTPIPTTTLTTIK